MSRRLIMALACHQLHNEEGNTLIEFRTERIGQYLNLTQWVVQMDDLLRCVPNACNPTYYNRVTMNPNTGKSLDMTMRLKAEQSTITRKHKYSQPENSYPPDNAFISSATLLPLGPSDQNFSFHLPQAPLPPRTLSPSLTLIPTGPARLADVSSCMP